MKRIIVAIDGPAASGKSTTAKLLADKLGYIYLDTGAMYRACALQALRESISITDTAAITDMMGKIDITIGYSESGNVLYLNGEDISAAIRTPEMSSLASAISAVPEVRYKMVALQRKLGENKGIVLDGRDIGTVVFPEAEFKFYLVADVHERAKRRCLELMEKGIDASFEDVLQDLEARDLADASRALAPLKPAADARVIDTSNLSIEAQVEKLYQIISDQIGKAQETFLARHSGYCFGVRRALRLAYAAHESGEEVFSLGPLIHNPIIVQELEDTGIKAVSDAGSIENSIVIIRSHGITLQDYELLISNNNKIIDATCPYVKRTHELIKNMVAEDCPILILGDKNHPEVIGMLSYGNDKTRVIAPGEPIPANLGTKLCLISQTTQKLQNLQNLACELLANVVELRIFNTICGATSERQNAAVELARNSDLMIVIGGYNSSNTRALASLCQQICLTFHIENADELEGIDFSGNARIGLSAGASTPEEMIVQVYNILIEKSGESVIAKCIEDIPLFKEESC